MAAPRRWLLCVLALVACRRAPPAQLDDASEAAEIARLARGHDVTEADRRAAALLARSTDPLAASTAVRQLASGGCARLATALAALDRRAAALPARLVLGLVDDARDAAACAAEPAATPAVPAAKSGGAVTVGVATAIARSRARADRPADALEALASAPATPPVRLARATILSQLGRREDAVPELRAALAAGQDARTRVQLARLLVALGRASEALPVLDAAGVVDGLADGGRSVPDAEAGEEVLSARVAALAALGRVDEALALVRAAPIDVRPALSRELLRGVGDVDAVAAALARAPDGDRADVLEALAERELAERGRRAALPALARAAAAAPGDARAQETWAEALADAGQLDAALAAWDRAATLAPAAERPRLRPIVALAAHGRRVEAIARARRLAVAARRPSPSGTPTSPGATTTHGDADALAFASVAAAAAGDAGAALALAREAQVARPGDGHLAFQVARRLDDAGQPDAALRAYATLLVCGAHGRGWHRHEIAARLVELAVRSKRGPAAVGLLRAPAGCAPAEPADLDVVMRGVLGQLAR